MIKSACYSLKDSHLNEPRAATLCLNQECGTVCLEEWWTRVQDIRKACMFAMEMVQDAHPLCKSVRSTHHVKERGAHPPLTQFAAPITHGTISCTL